MARFATDFESETFERLSAQIAAHHKRNEKRSLYADAEKVIDQYRYILPNGMELEQTPIFWPQKAIDVFSSRLRPAGYQMQDASLLAELEASLTASNASLAERMAIQSALRHGPAFVFSSNGDVTVGEPEVIHSVSSALSATAERNRAGNVTSALELLDSRRANLHLPGVVLEVERRSGRLVVLEDYPTGTQRILCAPYVHGITTERPWGSSRITRPIMGFTDAGVRTFMRSEVSAEWYMHPRERMFGVDESVFDNAPGWVRTIGGIELVPDIHPADDQDVPDDLRRAEIHSSAQMSMQPFSDQMRMIAGMFSGAASIPPAYLGIVADSNPQSAQAVWANEIDLVRAVEDQYDSFNLGRRALALNTLTLLHEDFEPQGASDLRSQWQDAKTRSPLEQGQFVAQQVQVGNFQPGTRATLDLLPITPESARLHADANRIAGGASLLDKVLARQDQMQVLPDSESPADIRAKFDALGVAIRAGVDPKSAAAQVGLSGLEFTGAVPVALRMPEADAAALED